MKAFRLSTEIRNGAVDVDNKQCVFFQFGILQIMNNYAKGSRKKNVT